MHLLNSYCGRKSISCEKTIRSIYIGLPFRCHHQSNLATFYGQVEVENSHFVSQHLEFNRVTAIAERLNRTVVIFRYYSDDEEFEIRNAGTTAAAGCSAQAL